jgi:hypothetical protein
MKLREYLDDLNKLINSNPQTLDMEVIYSSDDEGNNYHKVIYLPSTMKAEDINSYHLEIIDEDTNHNVVCIN